MPLNLGNLRQYKPPPKPFAASLCDKVAGKSGTPTHLRIYFTNKSLWSLRTNPSPQTLVLRALLRGSVEYERTMDVAGYKSQRTTNLMHVCVLVACTKFILASHPQPPAISYFVATAPHALSYPLLPASPTAHPKPQGRFPLTRAFRECANRTASLTSDHLYPGVATSVLCSFPPVAATCSRVLTR